MPVVQPVLGTVTNTHTHMIIVGKSMPIDNYEQYKRVINHWETTHAYTYKPRKKKTKNGVCIWLFITICF